MPWAFDDLTAASRGPKWYAGSAGLVGAIGLRDTVPAQFTFWRTMLAPSPLALPSHADRVEALGEPNRESMKPVSSPCAPAADGAIRASASSRTSAAKPKPLPRSWAALRERPTL